MSEINIRGFAGSNNVKTGEQFFVGPGIVEPRIVLNSDVDLTGRITARKGKTLHVVLAGAHSLWAGHSCMLCVAGGSLYRIHQGAAANVGTVSGPVYPLSYAEVDDLVYMSNPYWQGGVFDPSSNTLSAWGVSRPPGPMLLAGDGGLPAGTYYVTMTNVTGSELSGNGPIVSITLSSTGGIQVLNRPVGALVWITDSNEHVFYLVGAVDTISSIPTQEPLPSFMCAPPPGLDNLCYAFGRIWGSVDQDVYYSQPYRPGLFKLQANKYSFDATATLIARVPTGIFVGMNERTIFLKGTDPSNMEQMDAGAGSIKGTLAYCNNLPDLSSVLGTAEKGFTDIPVWLTTEGIVAGNQDGRLFNLTKNKLKMGIPSRGASLYRNREGIFQFLTSFRQGNTSSGIGFADTETSQIFEDGQVDTSNKNFDGAANRVGFADTAICQVYRGGVEI